MTLKIILALFVAVAFALGVLWYYKGQKALRVQGKPPHPTTSKPFHWEELEATLLTSDLGVELVKELLLELKKRKVEGWDQAYQELSRILYPRIAPYIKAPLEIPVPGVIFVVGSNGTGKTTSAAKIAFYLKNQGKKVLLGAADTFRAAATEQLRLLGDSLGIPCVGEEHHRDPRARVYAAITFAHKEEAIAVLDTGGRNPRHSGLLKELRGMLEVGMKAHGKPLEERWLVLDAHHGMIALELVEAFHETVKLTGIFVAKWDSISGGGFLLPLWERFSIPLVGLGTGEKPQDLLLPTPEIILHKILLKQALEPGVLG